MAPATDAMTRLLLLRLALADEPMSPQLNLQLGRVLLAAGDADGARQALETLRRSAPDWPETADLATALEESER
jgi:cytochrome c-type biogenesis protein CcmH/NrfG